MDRYKIKFINWIISSREGTVGLLFGLLIVPLIAFIGMAIDYSQARSAKAKLQQIVDSAAIAGARLPATSSEKRYEAATNMLKAALRNSKLDNLAWDVKATNASVSVEASHVMQANFMRIMGIEHLDVKASTAAQSQVENGGVACLIALNETTDDGLHIQGINTISSRNCWAWVNSNSPTAINADGAAMAIGQGFCSHGGSSGADHFAPPPYSECDRIEDPFVERINADHPYSFSSDCDHSDLNVRNGSFTLTPGVYCGNTVLKPQAEVMLQPGTYIFRGGYLQVQAQASLKGEGVTLFFVGSNTRMEVRGGGHVDLRAPREGELAGFVIVDRKYSWNSITESKIQGGGRIKIEGIVYAPQWKLIISGNGEMNEESKYIAMIADSFFMEGNGQLYVNADAKAADLPDLMPRIKYGPRLLY